MHNIKASGGDIQSQINTSAIPRIYDVSNIKSQLNIDIDIYYKGCIEIPAGVCANIFSSTYKGVIDANNSNRCITSFGATSLTLKNLTLVNGITPKSEQDITVTKGNVYLTEYQFNSFQNGGGCCILGNTVVYMRDITIKSCIASKITPENMKSITTYINTNNINNSYYNNSSGGGFYMDTSFDYRNIGNYILPNASFIIYNDVVYTSSEEFKYTTCKGCSSSNNDTIELKSDYQWYSSNVISPANKKYLCVPAPNEDNLLYVHGYLLDDKNELTSIQTIISKYFTNNKRGYQFVLKNNICDKTSNIILENNKAEGDGGGFCINNVSYYIDGNSMQVNNNASNGYGGGVCIKNTNASIFKTTTSTGLLPTDSFDNSIFLNKINKNMIIRNIIIYNNSATIYGGGLYYGDNYSGILENITVDSNTTYGSGGGIFIGGNQRVNFPKSYSNYNGNYYTKQIKFNKGPYKASLYEYDIYNHNIVDDIYTNSSSQILLKSNEWINSTEPSDTILYSTKGSTLQMYNNNFHNLPNYFDWTDETGQSDIFRTIVPNTSSYLSLVLNNITCTNNEVINDIDIFNSRYDRLGDKITLLSYVYTQNAYLIDIPFITGGGISIFSANNVTLTNNIIENNKADNYGGGLTVFNDINSIDTLGTSISKNFSSKNKGNDLFFIGNHDFYINLGIDNGITQDSFIKAPYKHTFFSDIIYISAEPYLKNMKAEYFKTIDQINHSNLSTTVHNTPFNFLMLFRDYYQIKASNYLHFKGTLTKGSDGFYKGNNLFISTSVIKPIQSKSILNNIENNDRIIDVEDFYTFSCGNLYFSKGNEVNSNDNNLKSIESVSGGTIKIKNIQATLIDNIEIHNSTAVYGGAIAQFSRHDSMNATLIRDSQFYDCYAHNIGGAYFNFTYKDNKQYTIQQLNLVPPLGVDYIIKANTGYNVFICNDTTNTSIFENCHALNRGGAIFCNYNSTINIFGNKFKDNTAQYGDDLFASDQSSLFGGTLSKSDKFFIEGSTINSKIITLPTPSLTFGSVYVDDFNTDIYKYNSVTNSYQKGIDKYFPYISNTNIETVKSQIKANTLYQLYEYDYVANNAIKSDNLKSYVTIIDNYNTDLYFQSRLVKRNSDTQTIYKGDTQIIKGIFQEFVYTPINKSKAGLYFTNIKGLLINRIKVTNSDTNTSIMSINNVNNIDVNQFIGDFNNTYINGGVFDIIGDDCNITLGSKVEMIRNSTLKSGYGGALYADLEGESSFIIGNKADKASIIVAYNYAYQGGAFYITAQKGGGHVINTSSSTTEGNFVEYNKATYGGAFYFNNIDSTIQNLNINNNYANQGGAIYLGGNTLLTLDDVNINNNGYRDNDKGQYYNIPANIGGGVYITPNSGLTMVKDVYIKSNNMYWGGGVFNDVNPTYPIRIKSLHGSNSISGNSNYDLYIVGYGKLKSETQYTDIDYADHKILETIDVGITFADNTKSRFFTYPIKGDPSNDDSNCRLNYLFNDWINTGLKAYDEHDGKIVKALDIKIYSDTFEFDKDHQYTSTGGDLVYININGELKGPTKSYGHTKFESVSSFPDSNDIEFTFNDLSNGIDIHNTDYNRLFEKSGSLFNINNVGEFNYYNNLNSNIFGYQTTTFSIKSVKSINIKGEFDNIGFLSIQKSGTNYIPTYGGFINIDNSTLSDSTFHFNPSLKSVGSYLYNGTSIHDNFENADNYILPYGGIIYTNNVNLFMTKENSYDGYNYIESVKSIAYDGGFLYKNLLVDDKKLVIVAEKAIGGGNNISFKNFNSYNNGGCLSIVGIKSDSYALIKSSGVTIDNCNSIKGYGGAVFMNNNKSFFNNFRVNTCSAKLGGGAFAIVSFKGTDNNSNYMTIQNDNVILEGNIAMNGSQIYSEGSRLDILGMHFNGAAYINRLKADSSFKGNSGGAIYAESTELLIDNCVFTDFSAYNQGGVIYYNSNYKSSDPKGYTLTINDTTFKGNNHTGIIPRQGGAIYVENSGADGIERINILGNTTIENYNANIGGGICIDNKVKRDLILNINGLNQHGCCAVGDILNNMKANGEIHTDIDKLEGFGGGIFMNNVKSIIIDTVNMNHNSTTLKYPIKATYSSTYGAKGYTDNMSDNTIEPQSELLPWNNIGIPSGGGIFMMNGITSKDITFKGLNNIFDNTPDDIFPFIYHYNKGGTSATISKNDVYDICKGSMNGATRGTGSDEGIHLWSLITGESGGNTTNQKADTYGKGGTGALVESNIKIINFPKGLFGLNSIKALSDISCYSGDSQAWGRGGKGGKIIYNIT